MLPTWRRGLRFSEMARAPISRQLILRSLVTAPAHSQTLHFECGSCFSLRCSSQGPLSSSSVRQLLRSCRTPDGPDTVLWPLRDPYASSLSPRLEAFHSLLHFRLVTVSPDSHGGLRAPCRRSPPDGCSCHLCVGVPQSAPGSLGPHIHVLLDFRLSNSTCPNSALLGSVTPLTCTAVLPAALGLLAGC